MKTFPMTKSLYDFSELKRRQKQEKKEKEKAEKLAAAAAAQQEKQDKATVKKENDEDLDEHVRTSSFFFLLIEQCHEKTWFLDICKSKGAYQLLSFAFATWLVQSLYFLNQFFQVSIHLLWLYMRVYARTNNPKVWFSRDIAEIVVCPE